MTVNILSICNSIPGNRILKPSGSPKALLSETPKSYSVTGDTENLMEMPKPNSMETPKLVLVYVV